MNTNRNMITFTQLVALGRGHDVYALFFQILSEKLTIIYDWNLRVLWVINGGDESVESSRLPISEREFVRLVDAEVMSQSDLVVFLLKSDIEVDVRNYSRSFRTLPEFQNFMEGVEIIATSKSG